MKLMKELIEKKKAELKQVSTDCDKIADDFLKWKDLQDNYNDQKKLKEDTESAKVRIRFLDIQVKLLEEAVQQLNDKSDELKAEQVEALAKHEELTNSLKVQEETAHKRLMLKLNRDKTQEVKDLIANQELIKAHNDEMNQKLHQQKEEYDKLLKGNMEAQEKLKLKTEQLNEDTEIVKDQELKLADLKKKIEEEEKAVNDLTEKIDKGKEEKTKEEDRNRKLHQQNVALSSKKEFIEENYDFCSHAEKMNLEVFRELMRSNANVNETVNGFVGKVDVVKQEVQKYNAAKYSFWND